MVPPWMSSLQLVLLPLFWRGIYTTETNTELTEYDSVKRISKSAELTAGDSRVEKIEIWKPIELELECTCNGNSKQLQNITGFWRKDGSEISDSRQSVLLENEQYNLKKVFNITENNHGNYSCIFIQADKESSIEFHLAVPEMDSKKNKPIISYVGDSVTMGCKIKIPPTTWVWYKRNGTERELINTTTLQDRYEIKIKGNTTKLILKDLTEGDSGLYICSANYIIKASVNQIKVRVISYMEPLKPFLAIMAEVVILVVLIFLYERWSSKKNSSPTENVMHVDQMHKLTQEDKNGVEENTTRQRKV